MTEPETTNESDVTEPYEPVIAAAEATDGIEEASPPVPALPPGLVERLSAEPLLCALLNETLAADRWMITVHRKVRDAPPNDLEATNLRRQFTVPDMIESMQALCRASLRDEAANLQRQTARAEDGRNWR